MSIIYKGQVVNTNNYLTVFSGYSLDVLDEIRLAILDDTPIAPYISSCKEDSYRLGQLRLAIKEYVPRKFLNPYISGACMFKIRKGLREGLDMSPVLKYVRGGAKPSVPCHTLERMLDVILAGGDISKTDFTAIANNLVGVVCEGLLKNYPMWLFENETLSEQRVRLLMRGMALNIDVSPFVSSEWSDAQIRCIFLNAKLVDINFLLSIINSRFSTECIECVVFAITNNLDYTVTGAKDSDGNPVFNEFQMDALNTAMQNGVLTEEMCNPQLSDIEIQDKYLAEISNKKVLGGVLPKD